MRFGPAIASALLGCTGDLSITIPPPSIEGARSIVVVILPEEGPRIVEARDVDASWVVNAELDREQPFDVVVLSYAGDLDSLRLMPGPQGVVPAGRPLPDALVIQRAHVEKREASPWEPIDEKPEIQIEPSTELPCARLEGSTLRVPGTRRPVFLVDLGAGEVLIGVGGGALYRARPGGSIEPYPEAQTPPNSVDGLVTGGELVLLTYGPCLYTSGSSGTALRSCAATSSTSTTALGSAWLAGSARSSDELVILIDDGRVYVERSRAWTLLLSLGVEPSRKGGIAYLGDGHAIAVGPFGRDVVRWRNDVVSIEPIRLSDSDKVISVLDHLTLGPIVGSNFGVLARDAAGEWSEFAQPVFDQALELGALDDGILAGGNKGSFVQVLGDGQACSASLLLPGDATDMIPFEGGYAVISEIELDGYLTFLRIAE